MQHRTREICCHGFERPKTGLRNYPQYVNTPELLDQKEGKQCTSVALQTESPNRCESPVRPLTRSKTSMGLVSGGHRFHGYRNEVSPSPQQARSRGCSRSRDEYNDFFQRYRAVQLTRTPRETPRETPLSVMTPRLPVYGVPVYRTGRAGSSWRHMKRVTGLNGENIMYIDGSVKESDCHNFPPHGYPSAQRPAPGPSPDQMLRLAQLAQFGRSCTPNNSHSHQHHNRHLAWGTPEPLHSVDDPLRMRSQTRLSEQSGLRRALPA